MPTLVRNDGKALPMISRPQRTSIMTIAKEKMSPSLLHSPLQDLWCSPPRSVATLMRTTRYRIQVLSHRGKAEIRDDRTTGVVNEDIWLTGSQHGGEMRYKTTTYTLEVPVYHITRVEVAEAFSDVR